ncbi:homoserine dehydrogenase [Anaeromicrobium sediminis]|uniref:Homoserine dehydrogenase n=1 Tax=Anaeromicrobium sediminis TaxID=1478221 RepID=A0A267MBD1_9FIRM|nr:homoserine dehydrogenase [Anaeromicrobium sediminis]PAB56165.1 hypothetical protein CCE28_21205 [Anaeromicrobium sediminis]
MINVGLLGLGTVGSGVYEILNNEENNLKKLLGKDISVKKILVNDINKKRQVELPKDILTTNPYDILHDDNIHIVVEVIGGIDKAHEYICEAFKNNKHVVTANKAVVAKYMDEFLFLSNKYEKGFLFEASVAGGIPIIKPLKQNVRINNISEIKGILNGTTNFILTKMIDDGLGFDEALKLAQELGYAEADPTDDVEGFDVKRKLAILASIAFNNQIDVDSIKCSGITNINTLDISMFKKLGASVKLVGSALSSGNKVSASVEPVLVNKNSTMATVKGAFNIVSIVGDTIGQLQFYGQGAGKKPTANAVVCDIYDIISGQYKTDHFIQNGNMREADLDLFNSKYYLRVNTKNISRVLGMLDKNHIQKFTIMSMKNNLVLITDNTSAKSIEIISSQLNTIGDDFSIVRLEDDLNTNALCIGI